MTLKPLWDALYAAGADVVVGAHDHDYERFVAQTPEGKVVSWTPEPKKIRYRAYGEQTIQENAPLAPAIRVAQRPSR